MGSCMRETMFPDAKWDKSAEGQKFKILTHMENWWKTFGKEREREGKWKRERDSWRKPRVQAFIMWTCWHVNMLMINQFVPVAARLDLLTKWCSRARPKCKNCEHNRIDRAVRPAREWKSKVAFGFSWCTAQLSPCQWYAFHFNWQSSNTCGTAAWNDDCTCSPWCCTILWPASASFHCSVWFNNATRRDFAGLAGRLAQSFQSEARPTCTSPRTHCKFMTYKFIWNKAKLLTSLTWLLQLHIECLLAVCRLTFPWLYSSAVSALSTVFDNR